MYFPMKFFDGLILACGSITNLNCLPKRQLWATFLICINLSWLVSASCHFACVGYMSEK